MHYRFVKKLIVISEHCVPESAEKSLLQKFQSVDVGNICVEPKSGTLFYCEET